MASMTAPLRIGTLNVRGLGTRRKQYQLKRLMQEKDLDLLAVQETKVSTEDATDSLVAEFSLRYNACVSYAVGASAGCIIFVKNSLGIVVEEVKSCLHGRFVLCDFCYGNTKFRVICVYAPTNSRDRCLFFREMQAYFECEKCVILLGDFNCVLTLEDCTYTAKLGDESVRLLRDSLNKYFLHDVALFAMGGSRQHFTHFQGSSHARLDRAYVCSEIVPLCQNYDVYAVPFSDHCLVSFEIGRKCKKKVVWETWKLNTKIITHEGFVEKTKKEIKNFFKNAERSATERWELFKQKIKMNAIECGCYMQYQARKQERELRAELNDLVNIEAESPGLFAHQLQVVKNKIECLEEDKYKGAIIRARAERYLVGEAPTKRALSDEKAYARAHDMLEIEWNGKILREHKDIKKAFENYY